MKQLYSKLTILAMMIAALSFTACGSDDDDEIVSSPDSYILGTWRAFKGEVFYDGESTVLDIDKTGANSASYMEFKFEKDNKLTAWWWVQDDNNLSHWTPLQTTPRPLKFPSPFGEGAGVRPRGRGGVSVFLHITPFISFL